MNTLVEIYSVDAAPNLSSGRLHGKWFGGFPVVTCEIPLTPMGNYLLNNLWGLVHSNVHINVARAWVDEVWSWWRLKVECHHPPCAMVRFCDDSADIGWCSRNNATWVKSKQFEMCLQTHHNRLGFKHKIVFQLGNLILFKSDFPWF